MEPFGTTVFCDDIRFETFNKISLVGIYGPELIHFSKFPLWLPKFGIYISVRFPGNYKIDGAKFLMYFPGDPEDAPTSTIDLPWKTDGISPMPDPKDFPDLINVYGFNQHFIFSPITIKQAGYIRIRILEGTNRIKIGVLKLREATSAEIISMQAPEPTA